MIDNDTAACKARVTSSKEGDSGKGRSMYTNRKLLLLFVSLVLTIYAFLHQPLMIFAANETRDLLLATRIRWIYASALVPLAVVMVANSWITGTLIDRSISDKASRPMLWFTLAVVAIQSATIALMWFGGSLGGPGPGLIVGIAGIVMAVAYPFDKKDDRPAPPTT